MGVISSRIRRHRRTRLAAEMACTWNPRRLFPLGTEQGGVYYPDNPDSLLRRVNLLSATATLSTQSITATPRQQTLSFKGTGTVTLSGASTAGPLVGTGASDRVTLTFTPTAASLTLTVTGTVTEAQLELGPAFTTYQPVTTWTTDYMAAVGHLVTQYQDSAGTTAVQKVGDPVGLTLDRRFGLYRGPQLLTSGAIGLTGAATAATYSTSTGAGTVTRVDASNQSWVQFSGLTAGRSYQITVSGVSGGTLQVRDGSATGAVIASTTSGTPCLVTATGTTITLTASAAATVAFTVTQIQWLPGNHRIQATSGSRKTLSARVNLLTKSEQFDDATWFKTTGAAETSQGTGLAAVVTANHGTAPNGTTTADRLQLSLSGSANAASGTNRSGTAQNITVVSGVGYKTGIYLKALDGTNLATIGYGTTFTVGLSAGGTITYGTPQSVGDGWFLVPATMTASSTVGTLRIQLISSPGSTLNTLDLLVWGADLRTADDAAKNIPAYQRVNTASDYDTDGFPHYWAYDGTDDCDATASTVDGSAYDKVTAIVGATKLSDAAVGLLIEHTANSSTNTGAFTLFAPGTSGIADYDWRSKGTVLADADLANSYAAPRTDVITCSGDISGDVASVRLNGVLVQTAVTDQGTGNYANATGYFGRRGGASNPFNGREYATIERFGPMSDGERNQAERWVARQMGVTI